MGWSWRKEKCEHFSFVRGGESIDIVSLLTLIIEKQRFRTQILNTCQYYLKNLMVTIKRTLNKFHYLPDSWNGMGRV